MFFMLDFNINNFYSKLLCLPYFVTEYPSNKVPQFDTNQLPTKL